MILRTLIATTLLVTASITSVAAELTVYSSIALRGAMETIAPKFEQAMGSTTRFEFGAAPALARMIKAGKRFDVVILTPGVTSELISEGLIRDARPFVRTYLGLAVRHGTHKPSIETQEEFTEILLKADKIAFSKEGASGLQFAHTLKETGLDAQLGERLMPVSGFKELEMVAEGHASIGIQMVSEIASVSGVLLVGRLPGKFEFALELQTAVAVGSSNLASSFIEHLRRAESIETLRANGLTPF